MKLLKELQENVRNRKEQPDGRQKLPVKVA